MFFLSPFHVSFLPIPCFLSPHSMLPLSPFHVSFSHSMLPLPIPYYLSPFHTVPLSVLWIVLSPVCLFLFPELFPHYPLISFPLFPLPSPPVPWIVTSPHCLFPLSIKCMLPPPVPCCLSPFHVVFPLSYVDSHLFSPDHLLPSLLPLSIVCCLSPSFVASLYCLSTILRWFTLPPHCPLLPSLLPPFCSMLPFPCSILLLPYSRLLLPCSLSPIAHPPVLWWFTPVISLPSHATILSQSESKLLGQKSINVWQDP